MENTVPTPSKDAIQKYLNVWETLEKYTLTERTLNLLFNKLSPENTDIESVLLKVSALNDFYSTNIYDTYTVSKHILTLNVDERLKAKGLHLVNDMSHNISGTVTAVGKRGTGLFIEDI